ncbi:MAG TPA: ABC-2 family transporter protein [Candidatus Sulfotelmatobacter sp.]|jgi:ABC-2 type transport system permease protein|nr:ABC-2 family transporter protein [Candidatus Sulfotelmatobacter sp.]
MNIYFRVAKNTWDEMMTYRFNFMMWRIRNVLQLLTVYYLWVAVTIHNGHIFSYSRSLILTYVLGVSFIGSIVFSTRTQEMGENINNGELSQYLIRPLRYLGYWFARDIGDKFFNISFALAELTIVYLLLRPAIYLQLNGTMLILTVVAVILAVVMNFFIGSLLGLVAFWSPEVWAPRFIFFTLVSFFSGGLFPLDILPVSLQHIFSLLPFGYLQYFPITIYLGKVSSQGILQGFTIAIIWNIFLYFLLLWVWRIGLRMYSSEGN